MDNNEPIVEEEQDIIDMLATQSEDTGEDGSEIDTDTDDIEVLRDRIAKRNKAIRKSKQANHRIQDEKDALEKRIDELEKLMSSPAPNTEAQKQEQKEALEQWRSSVAEEPGNAIDYVNYQVGDLKQTVVDLLTKQQSSYEAKIAEIKGEIDPEKNKYRDKINALRQNPDFKDLDDKTLMIFAKNLSEKVPRGTIGGRRATPDNDPDKRLEELKAMYTAQYSNG